MGETKRFNEWRRKQKLFNRLVDEVLDDYQTTLMWKNDSVPYADRWKSWKDDFATYMHIKKQFYSKMNIAIFVNNQVVTKLDALAMLINTHTDYYNSANPSDSVTSNNSTNSPTLEESKQDIKNNIIQVIEEIEKPIHCTDKKIQQSYMKEETTEEIPTKAPTKKQKGKKQRGKKISFSN
ncbi:MAG: hypothetical protein HN564_03635 [Flavobacteriales bacterium]|jgi:hypothetical protein|nr:hypothetical protein [Flavobacteriales bacterium]